MKARVKETGKFVEVIAIDGDWLFCSDGVHYGIESLEGIESEIDYWTRLEHTYAGMAMQGLLSSGKLNIIMDNSDVLPEGIAIMSRDFAHALVEKMKNQSV